MKNTQRRSSNKKKLVSAISMLTVSAVMLSTATYAWFTMSREVEVKNIKMTATVPEDLQVSVGKITAGKNLNDADSYLTANGETAPDANIMWSNMVDISQYYTLGKIIPASSTTGMNVYFTPDATAVGKTVADDAEYITAASGLQAQSDANTSTTAGVNKTYMSTLHVNTAAEATAAWTGTPSSTYNVTNDDGYYVDVPIWLRTSSDSDVTLTVDAYVAPYQVGGADVKGVDEATVELYKAARVVIIDPTGDKTNDTTEKTAVTSKLIPLLDTSWSGSALAWNYYGRTATGATSDTTTISNAAVTAAGTYGGSTTIYAGAEYYDKTGANKAVCTVPGSSTAEYGNAKKVYARIWLEGEDQECWNQNAGQNFSINLKFSKIDS